MLWHRLAIALGATVDELQERMSAEEFMRWAVYYQLEPFGYEWQRWCFGMVAASISNAVYSTVPVPKGKARPKVLQVADFFPPSERKVPPQLTTEQAEHIRKKRARKHG